MYFIQNIVGHSHGDNLHTAEPIAIAPPIIPSPGKANALAEKIAELYKKMGPEFAALIDIEKACRPKFGGWPGNRFNSCDPRRIFGGQ
jgi:hypothetical protein